MTGRRFTLITASDREAARIILAERERYAGLPVLWAELWLGRYGELWVTRR